MVRDFELEVLHHGTDDRAELGKGDVLACTDHWPERERDEEVLEGPFERFRAERSLAFDDEEDGAALVLADGAPGTVEDDAEGVFPLADDEGG